MRTFLALLVTLALSAPAADSDPISQSGTTYAYTGPSVDAIWPTIGAVATIPVYSTVDRRYGVRRVVEQWNQAGYVRLVLTSTPCQGCITIRQSSDPAMVTYAEAGRATLLQAAGVIEHCDIVLNLDHFYPQWATGRRNVLAHELGHCLGLGHTVRRRTVMGEWMLDTDGPTLRDLMWVCQVYGGGFTAARSWSSVH